MICTVCGGKIRDEARFCAHCGQKVHVKKSIVNVEFTDKTSADTENNQEIDEENKKFIETETLRLFKEKSGEIDFPERGSSKYLSNLEIPSFKGLRGREVHVSITARDIEKLMEKEGIEFRDGLWKKDFEGICAICSLDDTLDLVYHCIKGKNENKFCCELHGYLNKKTDVSGIYSQFVFPENWDGNKIELWKKDITRSEQERREKTLDYYKTGMMEKLYCCVCDEEIDFIEQYQNGGFCEKCKTKKSGEESESEKLWQLEVGKYRIGSVFEVLDKPDTATGDLETGQMYQLKYKKGKRVYMARLDLKGKPVTGKGHWYLGIPHYFKHQPARKITKAYK
ncbi:MAG: zinc-ribbon domain-containing protein [Candidatus Eremiobacterota bacterium]